MYFILPLGISGLSQLDLSLKLYKGIISIPIPLSVTVTEDSKHNYKINNLPIGSTANHYTLTAQYNGIGYSFLWGGQGSPGSVIIPVRESGLNESNFTPVIYKDGILQSSVVFDSDQIDPPNGDYSLSGWPVESNKSSWLLMWEYNGITNYYTWNESNPVVTSTLSDEFGSNLFPAPIIRTGVKIISNLTKGVQTIVTHEAYIGEGISGGKSYATLVSLRSIVKRQIKTVMMGGQLIQILADITVLSKVKPNGTLTKPLRREPIDPRDRITLRDGMTGVIVASSPGFVHKILLG